MDFFPIGLAQDLMVDRLISKVKVKITRSGLVTYTDKLHHGISADLLARKLGIGLDKSKQTLQSTTHDYVRSALKPLTRRYRKYLLLQMLRRLNCRFYTDTIFAKEKSIVGNTCTQIFTDGDFFQIISMRFKSEAVTKLYRINRDVGVSKKYLWTIHPIILLLTQKCRDRKDWKEWMSKPLSHTPHGETKLKVLLRQLREMPREEEFRGM